jgi:hypothetical protein
VRRAPATRPARRDPVVDPHAGQRRPGTIPPTIRPIDPGRGDGGVPVRDPRDVSDSSGGVKVTGSSPRPIVRDHRDPVVRTPRRPGRAPRPAIANPGGNSARPPAVRAPRDVSDNSGGVEVTNSGARPTVRDHRDTPTVRDHRGR